ncbi:MAG TPA: hypothetical protein VNA29_04270 [Sphingomicrobium sp.]|nr:hypothetical protein [Sphingomicrobium sp.]
MVGGLPSLLAFVLLAFLLMSSKHPVRLANQAFGFGDALAQHLLTFLYLARVQLATTSPCLFAHHGRHNQCSAKLFLFPRRTRQEIRFPPTTGKRAVKGIAGKRLTLGELKGSRKLPMGAAFVAERRQHGQHTKARRCRGPGGGLTPKIRWG